MTDHHQELMELIPQYLDQQLSDADRDRFESALERDGQLRAALEEHVAVDDALRRRFAVPSSNHLMRWVDDLPQEEVASISTRSTQPILWRTPLVAAAALGFVCVGIWLILGAIGALEHESDGPYGPHRTMTQAFQHVVDDGFRPSWVCEDDAEFQATFVKHYRQPLSFVDQDETALIGLTYANVFSGRTTGVLGTVDGMEVIVFVDHYSAVPENLESDGTLSMHRRRLGDLVLIEVSPSDVPVLLDAFFVPEGEWNTRSGGS